MNSARFDEKNKEVFPACGSAWATPMGTYWGFGDLFTGLQIACIVILGRWRQSTAPSLWGIFWPLSPTMATLTWPIRSLGRIFSEMSKAGVSVERLNYILNAKGRGRDAPGAGEPPWTGTSPSTM